MDIQLYSAYVLSTSCMNFGLLMPEITRVTNAHFKQNNKNWHIPPNILATTGPIFTAYSSLVDVNMGIIKLT